MFSKTISSNRGFRRTHPMAIAATSVAATLAIVLVGINFMAGEKKIEHHLTRMYSADSP